MCAGWGKIDGLRIHRNRGTAKGSPWPLASSSPTPPSSDPTVRSPRSSRRRCAPPAIDAAAQPAREVMSLEDWDAVVLGSAIYAAHWQKDARRFASRFRTELAARPLWLFSSGPLDPRLARADLPITPHGAGGHRRAGRHRPPHVRRPPGSRTPPSTRRSSPRTRSATSGTGTRSGPTRPRSAPRWRRCRSRPPDPA